MSSDLINQMILLFGLMAVGYICNKGRILDETSNSKFSTFLLKAALPATILNSAISQNSLEKMTVLQVTVIATGIFILVPVMSILVTKILKLDSTYQLMLNYSNLGFMGFPIINSIFGSDYVFYAAIFMMVFNVHIFTIGIITLQGKAESPKLLLKKLFTPGIIAAVLAFVIVFIHIDVPSTITSIVSGIGSVTTPLAMIVIGSQLAQVDLLKVLVKYQLYVMAVFKLIVYPSVIYVILYFICGNSPVTEISTILVGLPVAGNVTMLCSEYGGDTSLAAQGTCVSTLLSLVTIPIMLSLIH